MASFGEWLGQLGYGTRVDSDSGETVPVNNEDYSRVQGPQLEKLQDAFTRYSNPEAYGTQGYVPTLDSGLADQSSNTLDRGSDPYHVDVGGTNFARTGESLSNLTPRQRAALAQWQTENPGKAAEQSDPTLGWLRNTDLDNTLGTIAGQENTANDTPGWQYMAMLAAMAAGGYGLSEAGLAAGAAEGAIGAGAAEAGGAGLIEGATTAGLTEGAAASAGASEGFLAPLGQTFTDVAGPLGSNVAATAPFTGAPLAAPYAVAPELGVFGTANTASAAPGLIDSAKNVPGKLFDYAKDHPQLVITAAGLLGGLSAPGEDQQQRPLVPTAPPPPGMTANYSGLNTGLRPSGAVLKYRDGTPVYGPTGIINAATRRA